MEEQEKEEVPVGEIFDIIDDTTKKSVVLNSSFSFNHTKGATSKSSLFS